MSAPRFAPCRCGHPKGRHEVHGFTPQCVAQGCSCLNYRPDVNVAKPSTAPAALVQPPKPAAPVGQITPETPHPEPVAVVRAEPTDDEIFRARTSAPTIEQILRDGKKSGIRRTIALTEKIAVLIHDLRGRLDDEREAAAERLRIGREQEQARRAIAELEAALMAARARLKTGKPQPRPATAKSYVCPEPGCQETRPTPQGIGAHRRHDHRSTQPREETA